MSSNSSEYRSLLRHEGSDLSDASTALDTPQSTPSISFTHRQSVYSGPDSHVASPDLIDPRTPPLHHSIEQYAGVQGLGLSNSSNRASFPRKPRYDSSYHGPGLHPVNEADEGFLHKGRPSSFHEELTDTPTGVGNDAQFGGIQMLNHNDNNTIGLMDGCPSAHDIYSPRTNWLSMSVIFASIYSTLFSGLWFLLAVLGPRYGGLIQSTGGRLTSFNARTVFTLLAKTIEMTFVTVFVTFLGQVLSRRSLIKLERGVTISEMTMRTWVIQPGFMFTHFQNVQHAGLSVLGAITIVSALVAMFYTTASDALVSPHLKFGKIHKIEMLGQVQASYAHVRYMEDRCQTPTGAELDTDNSGGSCNQIMYAGQSYHDSIAYLRTWTLIKDGGGTGMDASSDMTKRPAAPSMLYDNTTVIGSWIETEKSNMTAAYAKHSRIINEVSLAMPHAGVWTAARHEKNRILQPQHLDNLGKYELKASVASPSINVLCANAKETELKPIVFATWPDSGMPRIVSDDTLTPPKDWQQRVRPVDGQKYLNSTVFDDIFHWGEKYERQPPVFALFPAEYNSIANYSFALGSYGSHVYLLIKAPSKITPDYTICQLKSFLSVECSTHYNVTGSASGHLESHCNHPEDSMAYKSSMPNATSNPAPDWRDVGAEWLNAVSLNNGLNNQNASNARVLSHLVQAEDAVDKSVKLNPLMPSLAEQLAVLAGNTLLVSSMGSSFKPQWEYKWNYQRGQPEHPHIDERFNATVRSQEYASGYSTEWERMFYTVLFLAFAINFFCLFFLFWYPGLVTDFTEQENLFALAMNSPPASRLSGSCGTGPEGEQLTINFQVHKDEGSQHYYIVDPGRNMTESAIAMRRRQHRRELRSRDSYHHVLFEDRKNMDHAGCNCRTGRLLKNENMTGFRYEGIQIWREIEMNATRGVQYKACKVEEEIRFRHTQPRPKLQPSERQKETSHSSGFSQQVTIVSQSDPSHTQAHSHSSSSETFLKPPTFLGIGSRKQSDAPSVPSINLNTPAVQLQPSQKQHYLAKLEPVVNMAKGTLFLKGLSFFLRLIQFGCTVVILGIFSYFLAVLANHDLPIATYIRAVEGIAGAGVLYTIVGLLLVCCLGGIAILSFIAMLLDVAFAGAFAYVAYATRGGRSCTGIVDTPLGGGDASGDNRVPDGSGGFTVLPSLRTACKLNTACFAVAIIAGVFFLLSIPLEVALIRHHKKEKAFGPSPMNNYTAGRSPSRKFWQRKPKHTAGDVEKPDALPMHATPADARMSYATESTAVTDRYGNPVAPSSVGTGWQTTTTTHVPANSGYGRPAANF
ncbi:hypothetical protein HYALB_00010942 [Hymenoscyphus albidus]|uniref:Uncharacterized protein n=1 Tax=Hymenoscyphus albidus TaxID=595503 RepID=A0A9N9LPS0_9HELO|nr:hypothetical protein HYALB_00010942 [Hymenoscyphus albidus]